MIEFEIPEVTMQILKNRRAFNLEVVRKICQYYDEYENEHAEMKAEEREKFVKENQSQAKMLREAKLSPKDTFLTNMMLAEERTWGASSFGGAATNRGLGNAAIEAVATPEQKARFGHLFAAMAITEPGCGSDTAAVQTTAVLDKDTNEWILNGEKIFVTSGQRCEAVVVWASLDRSQGRPAIKSFVVEKSRPGITVTKREKKLGIRSSDTVSIVLEDCRIPYDNILGSPEIKKKTGGIKGVMKTFDATRPGVAAGAVGAAQAALDLTREVLEKEGF